MTGTEWFIDVEGCPAEALRDLRRLQALCGRVIAELSLHVIHEPLWHRFPSPGGVTGMYLLSESHLTCHTFPETGAATFNLYCCRPRPEWNWEAALIDELGATRVHVRQVAREGMLESVYSANSEDFKSAIRNPQSAISPIASSTAGERR